MKINIFFFISDFNYGGAGNAVLNFLKNLNRKRFNIYIIFLGKSDYENVIPHNIKIIRLKKNFIFFNTFLNFFHLRSTINHIIQNNKKNVFISNIHYSNILSVFFLKNIKNLKIFLFERTSIKELDMYFSLISFIKNKIVKLSIKFFYSSANQVFANSLTGKAELSKIGIKTKVIYSGSITKIFPQKKFKTKKFFKIISVGRLTKQKNYKSIIDAIQLIKKRNFKYFIYGDGNLHSNLKNYIFSKNLNKKIKIMSHEKDKNKIYKQSDLLVHASLFEGLPNCIVEAFNYGVPVIAYDGAGGISEILGKGKYGKLIKKNNKYEISKNINNFLQNPSTLQNKVKQSKLLLKKFIAKETTKNLEREIFNMFK